MAPTGPDPWVRVYTIECRNTEGVTVHRLDVKARSEPAALLNAQAVLDSHGIRTRYDMHVSGHLPLNDERTSGNLPMAIKPTLAPPERFLRPRKLSTVQRDEIRGAYRAARRNDPGLAKTVFASRVAPMYDVAESTVRGLLRNL